jgi:hypothetical protein
MQADEAGQFGQANGATDRVSATLLPLVMILSRTGAGRRRLTLGLGRVRVPLPASVRIFSA